MKIKWDSTWLSDEFAADGFQSGLSLNGRQIVQEAEFLRAANAAFYARGNRAQQLSFTVLRRFDTAADAELFLLGHYATLVDGPASLLCRCGGGGETLTDVLIPNAVLESVAHPRYIGNSVVVTYTFRFAPVVTVFNPEDEELNMRSGSLAIPNNEETATFSGLAFPGIPARVIGQVRGPDGSDFLSAMIIAGTITADGFQINLSAVVPPAGSFFFDYIAVF